MTVFPLVSIIIPVYNGENYLREAIDSALAQTYKNCEILVVNDGSIDNTEKICLSYGKRIRYFKKENGGVATALNMGIAKMRGEYFSWLSHDDTYFPRKIELQMDALKKDGDMTKIVISNFEIFNQDTNVRRNVVITEYYDESKLTDSVFPVLKASTPGCALLMHRSNFERAGVFNPSYSCVQDYDLWFRMFRGRRHVFAPIIAYSIRIHGKQDTRTKRTACQTEERFLCKNFVEHLTDEEIASFYPNKFLFLLEMKHRVNAFDVSVGAVDDEHRWEDSEYERYIYEKRAYEKFISERLLEEIKKTDLLPKLKLKLAEISNNKSCDIAIFGTGEFGLKTYELLKLFRITVKCFIDNNIQKQGSEIIDGISCKSLEEIRSSKDYLLVVVGICKSEVVVEQLKKAKFPFVVTYGQIEEMLVAM